MTTGSPRCGNSTAGLCQCQPGWTGHSDAPTADLTRWGGDILGCRSHEKTLLILWATSLGLTIAVTLYTYVLRCACSRHLRTFRLKRAKLQRKSGWNAGRPARYRWWEHHKLLVAVVIFLTALLAHGTLCVIKLTIPHDALIGIHFLPTILVIISSAGVNLVGYFDLGRNIRKFGSKFAQMMSGRDKIEAATIARQQAKWAQRWQLCVVLSFTFWVIPCFFEPQSPWSSRGDDGGLSTFGLALVLSGTPQPVLLFGEAIN